MKRKIKELQKQQKRIVDEIRQNKNGKKNGRKRKMQVLYKVDKRKKILKYYLQMYINPYNANMS